MPLGRSCRRSYGYLLVSELHGFGTLADDPMIDFRVVVLPAPLCPSNVTLRRLHMEVDTGTNAASLTPLLAQGASQLPRFLATRRSVAKTRSKPQDFISTRFCRWPAANGWHRRRRETSRREIPLSEAALRACSPSTKVTNESYAPEMYATRDVSAMANQD